MTPVFPKGIDRALGHETLSLHYSARSQIRKSLILILKNSEYHDPLFENYRTNH